MNGSLLRLVEDNNEFFIIEDVLRSFRDELKDLVFNLFELSLEISHSDDELILLLLDLWLFEFDDFHEELIFKTIWCDSEVDQCYLDADLRQVVRVRHLCGHEELEFRSIRNHLITKFDVESTSQLDDVLRQNWLKGWVESLMDVLEQYWVSESDRCITDLEELRVRQLDYHQVVLLFHILDPLVALTLRINDQRPSLGCCRNDTVVD